MKKTTRPLLLMLIFILSIIFFNAVNLSDKTLEKNTSSTYNIKALKIPNGLSFAGEKVPTELDDIKERMDRELLVNTYWQSNGLLLIKRANKYFPIIEPILEKYSIPNDFKYLAVIESGLENAKAGNDMSDFIADEIGDYIRAGIEDMGEEAWQDSIEGKALAELDPEKVVSKFPFALASKLDIPPLKI